MRRSRVQPQELALLELTGLDVPAHDEVRIESSDLRARKGYRRFILIPRRRDPSQPEVDGFSILYVAMQTEVVVDAPHLILQRRPIEAADAVLRWLGRNVS